MRPVSETIRGALHHIQAEACWLNVLHTSAAQCIPVHSATVVPHPCSIDLCLAGLKLDSALPLSILRPLSMPPTQGQGHSPNDPSMALHPKLANSSATPRYKSLKLPEDFELSPWLPACFSRDPSRTRGEIHDSCCSPYLAAVQVEAALLSTLMFPAWGCGVVQTEQSCNPAVLRAAALSPGCKL